MLHLERYRIYIFSCEVRDSRVTKSTYETELSKMTSTNIFLRLARVLVLIRYYLRINPGL